MDAHAGKDPSPADPSMLSAVTLRKATVGEHEIVYLIRSASVKAQTQIADGSVLWDEAGERERHSRRFATQDYRIVDVSGEAVGIMAVVIEASVIRLNQFFVLPGWQQRGIGRAALALLLKEADEARRAIQLEVLAGNKRAQALYRGFGFIAVGHTAHRIQMERGVGKPLHS